MGDHYEYLGTWVDDFIYASKNPSKLIEEMKTNHKLSLREAGPLKFHLGCDYYRDKEGVLIQQPKSYISRLKDMYKRMFDKDPRMTYRSPLDKGDHP
jgi:hypothetical protein